MAILRVAQMGHPILRRVAEEVPESSINTADFQRFCDDMLETMGEYDGAGLAAPQVHTPLRVVVLSLDSDREPEFFINPEITILSDSTSRGIEGCLSVENLRAVVERHDDIRITALDRHGTPKGYELSGFGARVVQHECDHLDGVLYVDRCDTQTLAFLPEYYRFGSLDDTEEGEE